MSFLSGWRFPQRLQNAAFFGAFGRLTTATQVEQLSFERRQRSDPVDDMRNMFVEQLVDPTAISVGFVTKVEQSPNLIELHIKSSAMAHEKKPLDVDLPVLTVIVRSALWRRQDAGALIEPDCFDQASTTLGQLANFEGERHI